MGDQKKQRAAYDFLRAQVRSGASFGQRELADSVGWKLATARTYLSKHYADYLETDAPGTYRVIREFQRVAWDEFHDLVTQVRRPFERYDRATFQAVVVYDFLMPLTREDKLRKALDDLFYRESLERRIHEVGLDTLAQAIPRTPGAGDTEYINTVVDFIDGRIGGFSVNHVSGRFRNGAIVSREAAGKASHDHPYLMDETTAVVRFIIPCLNSKTAHDGYFDFTDPDEDRTAAISSEVKQIRTIFFELFVEALVPTIRGEKLIWMLETSPTGQRLYELNHRSRGGAKGAEEAEQDEADDDTDGSETPGDT
jgi:hypothetical protein